MAKVMPIVLYAQVACCPALRSSQMALESVNRFVCRTILNDYGSSYFEMLDRLKMLPVFQQVLHKRLLLSHRYSRKVRHRPGLSDGFTRDIRLRRLVHAHPCMLPKQRTFQQGDRD